MTTKQKTAQQKARTTKRKFKAPKYKSFRMSSRIKSVQPPLPSVWELGKRSVRQLLVQKKAFLGITLIYGFLLLIFVRGLSGGLNVLELKENLDGLFSGTGGAIGGSLALFGVLLGSASATNGDLASLYQTIILVLVSLALIWGLRQAQAENKVRFTAKEAFYKGCYAVIPFVLVVFIISLQLLPVMLANLLYAVVLAGGFAATAIEQALWFLLVASLALLSFYMIASSMFALYIVTLPNTEPMQALRAARELVRFRRWTVMRKILVLPIALIVLLAIVTLPSILLVPIFAEWVFFLSTIMLIPLMHSYMYALYRSLL